MSLQDTPGKSGDEPFLTDRRHITKLIITIMYILTRFYSYILHNYLNFFYLICFREGPHQPSAAILCNCFIK